MDSDADSSRGSWIDPSIHCSTGLICIDSGHHPDVASHGLRVRSGCRPRHCTGRDKRKSLASVQEHQLFSAVRIDGRFDIFRYLFLRMAFDPGSRASCKRPWHEPIAASLGHGASVFGGNRFGWNWHVVLVIGARSFGGNESHSIRCSFRDGSSSPPASWADHRGRDEASLWRQRIARDRGGDVMNSSYDTSDFDFVLVGGGLQSGLLASALKHHHPDARVALIERDQCIGGNHTWSFHPGDVPEVCRTWIEPLIKYRWSGYDVRLGKFQRHVGLPYASIPSSHFERVVSNLFRSTEGEELGRFGQASLHHARYRVRPSHQWEVDGHGGLKLAETQVAEPGSNWQLMTNTDVINVSEETVLTRCGQLIRGRLVIDCRGPGAEEIQFAGCGYQKFHGFELELEDDWPFEVPVIMESVVDQSDGFRFLYTLPFSSRRILVEDTRFSNTPDCDRQECHDRVKAYLRWHGLSQFQVIREESGVLPMPFRLPDPKSCDAKPTVPQRLWDEALNNPAEQFLSRCGKRLWRARSCDPTAGNGFRDDLFRGPRQTGRTRLRLQRRWIHFRRRPHRHHSTPLHRRTVRVGRAIDGRLCRVDAG